MPTASNEVKPHTESNSGKTKQTKFIFLCFSLGLRGGDINSVVLFLPDLGSFYGARNDNGATFCAAGTRLHSAGVSELPRGVGAVNKFPL